MMPPSDVRVRVEAAFPGATIELDPRRGDWCITPAAPIEVDGLLISEINCDYHGRIGAHRIVVTPAAIESLGRGRLLAREVMEDRLLSVSAHDLIAARRRLGV